MSVPAAKPANKNWLLVKFRQWHSWGGLFLSVFILLVATTGILLNHKHVFLSGAEHKEGPSGALTSSTDLSSIAVGFPRALEIARTHFGDVDLEKIELKDERGRLTYKVSQGEGNEIRIDAQTGEVSSKYGIKMSEAGTTSLNWAKIVDDLHTGKIFGTSGKLIIDFTSGVIIALTLTGLYLWGVPWLRKRRSARNRERNPHVRPQPHPHRVPAPTASASAAE